MQEHITFKMNLVSRLAAADCASDVAENINISKHTCTIIYHLQDQDNMDVLEVTFPQNGSLLFKILHHIIEYNIPFQMNLVSHMVAAVCASGNYINFNIAKHPDTVISHNNIKVWI